MKKINKKYISALLFSAVFFNFQEAEAGWLDEDDPLKSLTALPRTCAIDQLQYNLVANGQTIWSGAFQYGNIAAHHSGINQVFIGDGNHVREDPFKVDASRSSWFNKTIQIKPTKLTPAINSDTDYYWFAINWDHAKFMCQTIYSNLFNSSYRIRPSYSSVSFNGTGSQVASMSYPTLVKRRPSGEYRFNARFYYDNQTPSASYSQNGSTLNFRVNEPGNGWFDGAYKVKVNSIILYLEGTSYNSGNIVGSFSQSGDNYNYSMSLSTLKSRVGNITGNYRWHVKVQDNYGNSADHTVGTITLDGTAPEIRFYNQSGAETSDIGEVRAPANPTDRFTVVVWDNMTADPSIWFELKDSSGATKSISVAQKYGRGGGGYNYKLSDNMNQLVHGQTYTLTAYATDSQGNSQSRSLKFRFTRDVTAPTITFYNSNGQVTTDLGTVKYPASLVSLFTVGITDDITPNPSKSASISNGSTSRPVNLTGNYQGRFTGASDLGLEDGKTYTVTVNATDDAGNKASKSLKFKYWWDHIAPTIKFQNPEGRELPADLGTVKYPATIQNTIKMYVADNDTSSPEITVSIRGTLNGGEILNQRLNHSTLKTNVFNLANVDLQNKAVYTITATAKDQFGNSASKTVTFKYWKDIVAPTVKILNSAGKETADLGTIAFPAKFTDYFKVEASDDQTANPQVTTTVSGTGLRKTLAGSCANKVCTYSDNTQLTDSTVYTIEAVAVDDFGNQTKKTAKFNYKDDLVPPTVEFLSTSGSQITQLGNVEYPAVYTEFFRIRVADNVDKNPQLTAKFSLANGSQSVVLQPKRVSDGVYTFLPHSTAELKDKTEYMITAVAKDQRGLTTTKTIKFTYRGDMTKPNIHLADLKNLGRTLSSQLGEIVFPTEFTDVAGVTVSDNRDKNLTVTAVLSGMEQSENLGVSCQTAGSEQLCVFTSELAKNNKLVNKGSYSVRVTATDDFGNSNSLNYSFKWTNDVEPPTVKILSMTSDKEISTAGNVVYPDVYTNKFKVTVSDNMDSNPELVVRIVSEDGSYNLPLKVRSQSKGTYYFAPASDEELKDKTKYTIVVTGKDQRGLISEKKLTFTYRADTTRPTLTLINPQNDDTQKSDLGYVVFPTQFTDVIGVKVSDNRDPSPKVTAVLSGEGQQENLTVNCGEVRCTFSSRLVEKDELTDQGQFSILITATDKYGNATERTVKFKWVNDLLPPEVDFLSETNRVITELGEVKYPDLYTDLFRVRVVDNMDTNPALTTTFAEEGGNGQIMELKSAQRDVFTYKPVSEEELKHGQSYVITAKAVDMKGLETVKTLKFKYNGDAEKPVIEVTDRTGSFISSDLGDTTWPAVPTERFAVRVTDNRAVKPKVTAVLEGADQQEQLTVQCVQGPKNDLCYLNSKLASEYKLVHGKDYRITVTATDDYQNVSDQVINFRWIDDTTAPDIKFFTTNNVEISVLPTVVDPVQFSQLMRVQVIDDLDPDAQVSMQLIRDGKPLTDLSFFQIGNLYTINDIGNENLEDRGVYSVSVTATDHRNNKRTRQIDFLYRYDNEKPYLQFVWPEDKRIITTLNDVVWPAKFTDLFLITVSDDRDEEPSLTVTLSGGEQSETLNVQCQYTLCKASSSMELQHQTAYVVKAVAVDDYNNIQTAELGFTYIDDVTPPEITFYSESGKKIESLSEIIWPDIYTDKFKVGITDDLDSNPTLNLVLAGNNQSADLNGHQTDGIYTFEPASDEELSDRKVYTLHATARDAQGNVRVKDLSFTYRADAEEPKITMLDEELKEKAFTAHSVRSLSQIRFRLSDNRAKMPIAVVKITKDGKEPITDELPLIFLAENTYGVGYPTLFNLADGGNFTVSIEATDDYENTSVQTFKLSYVVTTHDMPALDIPAVNELFTLEQSDHTYISPVLFNYNNGELSEKLRLYARVEGDFPLSINGTVVQNGDTAEIGGSYDFAKTHSVLELDMIPQTEETGTDTVFFFTSGDTPIYRMTVKAWKPETSLKLSATEVQALYDKFNAKIEVANKDKVCKLTKDQTLAKTSNVVRDPHCLVRWVAYPADLETADSSAAGFISEYGHQEIAYETVIFNGEKEIVMSEGSAFVDISSAFDSVAYSLGSAEEKTFRSALDDANLFLTQTKGKACRLTVNEEEAVEHYYNSSKPLCLLRWEKLPEGLVQNPALTDPNLIGSVYNSGVYDVTWTVSTFTPNGVEIKLAEQGDSVTVEDPAPPVVEFKSSGYVDDAQTMIAVSMSENSVHVGSMRTDVVSSQQDIRIAIDGQDYWSKTVEIKDFYKKDVRFSANKLWEMHELVVSSAFSLKPEIKAEKSIKFFTVPSVSVKPKLELEQRTFTDQDVVKITGLVDVGFGRQYAPEITGKWDLRLVSVENGVVDKVLSDWQPADQAGRTEFELNLAQIQNSRIYLALEARVESPVPEYSEIRLSDRIALRILSTKGIDGRIGSNKLSGKAPFNAHLAVRFDRSQAESLGTVIWQIVDSNGSTETIERNDAGKLSLTRKFETGRYKVNAVLVNKTSGVRTETETVEVVAYRVPEIKIDGTRVVFEGDTASLSVETLMEGVSATDQTVVEYSLDGRKTYIPLVGGLINVTSKEKGLVAVYVRARDVLADREDMSAYSVRSASVAFRRIKGPGVKFVVPYYMEADREYTVKAELSQPYSGMMQQLDGWFIRDDGTKVQGTQMAIVPTQADRERGYMILKYHAFIPSYEDKGAVTDYVRRVRIQPYVWPEFSIVSNKFRKEAPATAQLRIRGKNMTSEALSALDHISYTWNIPEGVEVLNDDFAEIRRVRFLKTGKYNISAVVADGRGNSSLATFDVEIKEPAPISVVVEPKSDNPYWREPVTVKFVSDVSGGHPEDRIVSRTYFVDGKQIDGDSVTLKKGVYDVLLKVRSQFGYEAETKISVLVKPNQLPVCQIVHKDSDLAWSYEANCRDPDGRIKSYQWFVNGKLSTVSGMRISLSKYVYKDKPTLRLIVTDNSGDSSIPYDFQ